MKKRKRTNPSLGIIDIGSNTVLMSCGRLSPMGKMEILLERHDVARLSEGLKDGKNLSLEARHRTLEILERFKRQANEAGVTRLEAAGTAAFRRAGNGGDFAREIEDQLGIPVKILGGDQEAHYSFLSAKRDFGGQGAEVGMIDIGGGSTEIVQDDGKTFFSLPMGTVRFLDAYVETQPVPDGVWKRIADHIQETLKTTGLSPAPESMAWVAVAATPTSLAVLMQGLESFDPAKVHGFKIRYPALKKLVEKLRRTSIPERNRMPGMDPKRSELLPLGGLILEKIMEILGIAEVIASHHGLRYGLLWERLEDLSR